MRVAQNALGGIPIDAGVGDADAVFEVGQVGGDGLAAFVQVAFDHQADDLLRAAGALIDGAVGDILLVLVLLE